MIRVSGQSKSRPVKAAGAEEGAQQRNQKLHAPVAKKHILKWKCTKHVSSGALFEVLMSKNCTPLWQKTHYEVKMLKTAGPRALFEVLTSKNCTPLWRKTHYEAKMLKNWGSASPFWSSDVEKLHTAVAKSTLWSQNVKKTDGLGALFEVQMSKN